MTMLAVIAASATARAGDLATCYYNGIPLWGDVQVVDSFPHLKVSIVDSFPDLDVELDAQQLRCGAWPVSCVRG